jgi:hypothetical protein
MKIKSFVVLAVLAAVLIAALAPIALAATPKVTLKGPSSVNLNAKFTVSGTVTNPSSSKPSTLVTIQKKNGTAWQKVAQVTTKWINGKGLFTAKLKATNPTMSLIKYRAVYANSAGTVKGYSKTLIIAVQ